MKDFYRERIAVNRKLPKSILESREFIFLAFMIIVKLVLMGGFSSDYQNNLFIPFALDFVKNGGNTYQRMFNAEMYNAFPYPPVMLLVESFGALLINTFNVQNVFWVNALFKLPSFLIDLVGLIVLFQFFPNKKRYVLVFYYASPIVLYSVYMHGQLDLIPMIMLVCAVFFLVSKASINKRYIFGIIFTSLALLSKFHILASMPIILFYLKKRDGLVRALFFFCGVTGGTVLGMIPVWSDGFKRLVLFNSEQGVLTQVAFRLGTVKLYIPIMVVLFIYLLAYKINYMNRELFLNLCGIVFAVFLAFCPPMPGWYVWIVPFMTLFFASTCKEKYKNIYVFVILNGLYLVYFVTLHSRGGVVDLYFLNNDLSFLKIDNEMFSNGVFTLLSGTLIYLIISMYQLGVASNNLYKRKDIPFTIGISGDSAAGKSTMIDVIEKALGINNLLYIEGDGDHKWERGDRYWDDYTALNPKANYLYRQADDLKDLRSGSAIRRVDYDHSTGKFTSPRRIRSKKFILLCGLHAMYLPQTRKYLDLKIYMDADENLRRYWKIQRDITHRGHTKEAVLKSIEERLPDAEKYIYPQKDYADFIVRYYDNTLTDYLDLNHDVKISMQLTISAAVNVEPLVQELEKQGINLSYEYTDNLKRQIINIEADDLEGRFFSLESIAEKVIPQLEEITRERFDNPISFKDGLIILFLLLLISNKMKGIS